MNMTCRLMKSLVIAGVLAWGLCGRAQAAEVGVSVDFASDYVFRGVTLNNGMVLQPGLEVSGFKVGETDIPLTLGVWGNLDLERYYGNESGKFSEVDLYVSYDLPELVEGLGWSVGYVEYLYPGADADADRELNLGFSVDTLLSPSLTLNYGVGGAVKKDLYAELAIEHGVDVGHGITLTAGSALGCLIDNDGDDGFGVLSLSLAASWKMLTVSGTYYVQLDDDVLTDDLYDTRFVAMVGISHTF